ncbi:MAG TPA: glycosyltransferase family 4 protein [Actinomycetota bacterium]|nr:glycosyltransferase family 4 protein [Actinomycetota bacterium]
MPDALLVTSSFLPGRGGIESYLATLCDQLAPRLAVLAPGERDGASLPVDLPYACVSGPGAMLVPNRAVLRAIERALESTGTNKVLFGTPWPLILLGPSLARAGIPYATIVHGAELTVPGAVPVLNTRVARALALADLLLPVSGYTQEKTQALIARKGRQQPPSVVLYARVDAERFTPERKEGVRAELGLGEDDRIVLCFGRLVARKGVDRALRAIEDISVRRPGVVLVVAGTGPEEKKLRRLAARSQARVIMLGRVPDERAPGLYAAADVFALPVADRWFGLEIEGLGVVLLEAAAAGTPCVTGRSGGTPEAVIEGESGFVVDALDHSALTAALEAILTDPVEAGSMGMRGRAYVSERFSGHIPGTLEEWLTVEKQGY